MSKFKISVLFVLVFSILLTGCTYSNAGIDTIMTPPKLSKEQNEIYAALSENVGKNIKLKYPRSGEFTSAFLIANIDEEPTDEAIVFYENSNNSTATMPIRIKVLDQINGKWVSRCENGVEASEIEKVSFVNVNNQIYIIIGFTLLSKSEKTVKMFRFNEGMLKEISTDLCNNYEVIDIDGNGIDEVVIVSNKAQKDKEKNLVASVNEISLSGLTATTTVKMNSDVVEYVNINSGIIYGGKPALYLDGLLGNSKLSTEILILKDKKLTNLIYNEFSEKKIVEKTVRPLGSYSIDIDNDGIFEIPTVKPVPGYENTPKYQTQYFTDWSYYKDFKMEIKETSFVSYQLGYALIFSDEWRDKITLEYNIANNEASFYSYLPKEEKIGELLFSIKVLKKSEYDPDKKHSNYDVLKDNGQLIYMCNNNYYNDDLKINVQDIKECFMLL
ncbi:MAG: hypothetical protein RSA79_02640 [Oscillospiraceae bacterium]